ncbi:GNAT family N-acetyltransferase [Brachybacterium paraconglomeratum]
MSGKAAKRARRQAAARRSPRAEEEPKRSLPPGIRLNMVYDPAPLRSIDSAAHDLITDYNRPADVARHRRQLRLQLEKLFADDSRPTPSCFAVVATDETAATLYGAATLEPFLGEKLLEQDRENARHVAALHRILASLFVVPGERGRGIGSELLDAASLAVVRDQGRYLEGFVDDRDGSSDFYRRAGASVTSHNEPLPPRPPVNLKTTHYPGKDGHWFSVDGWERHHDTILCSRCGGALDYIPSDGGTLRCPRCQGP